MLPSEQPALSARACPSSDFHDASPYLSIPLLIYRSQIVLRPREKYSTIHSKAVIGKKQAPARRFHPTHGRCFPNAHKPLSCFSYAVRRHRTSPYPPSSPSAHPRSDTPCARLDSSRTPHSPPASLADSYGSDRTPSHKTAWPDRSTHSPRTPAAWDSCES